MLTVTQIAKQNHVSRTTVLYYERVGLLEPAARSSNGYRYYGEKESQRLKSILSYRSYGVPVQQIGPLLEQHNENDQEQLLLNQFNSLEQEIQKLRQQQKAILALVERPESAPKVNVDKERWSEIMSAAGFNEEDMTAWHKQFEKMEPQGHQAFLESLGIDPSEIETIREWSSD